MRAIGICFIALASVAVSFAQPPPDIKINAEDRRVVIENAAKAIRESDCRLKQ